MNEKRTILTDVWRTTARLGTLLLLLALPLTACTPTPTPAPGGGQSNPPLSAQQAAIPGYDGPYRPVGFVNQGSRDAMVMPCTWVPAGAEEPAPPPTASTVSFHPGAPGLWPNPSRFLSLPLGTYTWCIQWDEGDQDGDGMIDTFYLIDDRPVTLTEDDSEDMELAREVEIIVPPGAGQPTFPGTCDEAPACRLSSGPAAQLVADADSREFGADENRVDVPYDEGTVSLTLDPAAVAWIAWNDAPDVVLERASRPGERFLGPGGFGIDDYIAVTVTNPDGETLTVELDHNDAYGRWEGPQNVIYGSAEEAPDVFRQYPAFADPPSEPFFIDEAGSHNEVFTTAGTYTFRFSFRNRWTATASHPDVYLLVGAR